MAIGTTAALIGASVAGSAISAGAASKAGKAQERAAADQVAVQRETRDLIREDLQGYRSGGDAGLSAYLYEMGLGPRPTFGGNALAVEEFTDQGEPIRQGVGFGSGGDYAGYTTTYNPTQRFRVGDQTFDTRDEADAYAQANSTGGQEYQGFQATPGYQFQFDQGTAAVNALAGARGGLNSGRTMQDLTKFGQGLANQEYGNYLSRLGGLSDTGMNAAAMQGTASSNAAAGMSNALANRGNAQAAGAIGVGNALNTGIGNTLGILNYQQSLNRALPASTGTPGTGIW
jgi:hypothetical protein